MTQPLTHEKIEKLRHQMVQFLNEFRLEAPAILSISRRAELVEYHPEDEILIQGVINKNIFCLMEGSIRITIQNEDRVTELGIRGPINVLGEISFFNNTPPTATVRAAGTTPTRLFRLSYEHLAEVVATYPEVKNALVRIGEMRIISQYNGYIAFPMFMHMIGWKRDRLGVNRAMHQHLETAILTDLLPRVPEGSRLLDCGEGPGIVAELIHEADPTRKQHLYLQATHLEDAILNPVHAYPSDLSRTTYLKDHFGALIALQVVDYLSQEQMTLFLERAFQLLEPGGHLMMIHLKLVNLANEILNKPDTELVFGFLEALAFRVWPGLRTHGPLITVTFIDADFDPMMEWNPRFIERANQNVLRIPANVTGVERAMLELLLEQARTTAFNPDVFLYNWLNWNAKEAGFHLEKSHEEPEFGYFYQIFQRS